jgi:hypothetical protein
VDLSRCRQRFPGLSVRIVLRLGSMIEDHCLTLRRRVLRPFGKTRSIGIAGFHELQQGARHLRGQRSRSRAPARVSQHQIRVIKPETDIPCFVSKARAEACSFPNSFHHLLLLNTPDIYLFDDSNRELLPYEADVQCASITRDRLANASLLPFSARGSKSCR